MSGKPFLSVITPCYNRASLIQEALESVLQQNYDSFEHLVIDGGSNDGTQEVVRSYPHVQLISEPDQGLYDAINKGIARSRGQIITLLNSDDLYLPGCFSQVEEGFKEKDRQSVCGGVEIFRQEGSQRTILHTFNEGPQKELLPRNITTGIPLTNGRFFRREVYEAIGPYDLRYKIAADRQWLFRAWEKGVRSHPLSSLVYAYRAHEGSLTFNEEALCNPHGDHEYLRICEDFFEKDTLSREAFQACREWYTWETGYVMVQAFKRKAWQKALDMARKGWKQDPFWPFRFFLQAVAKKCDIRNKG